MSSAQRIETIINVEELWPHLAGKQTCASEDAGKVNGVLSSVMPAGCLERASPSTSPPHQIDIHTMLSEIYMCRYVGLVPSAFNRCGQAFSRRLVPL